MTELKQAENAAYAVGDAIVAGLLRDAKAWTGLQCDLLSVAAALWAECARHQSEVAEASARISEPFFDGRLVLEIAQVQHNWLATTTRPTLKTLDQAAANGAAWARETADSDGRAVAAANESAAQREAAE